MNRWRGILLAVAAVAALAACSSSGPSAAQPSLGPFTMTSCELGWSVPAFPTGGASWDFFTSLSAADQQSAKNTAADTSTSLAGQKDYTPGPASRFSITLNATAVVSQFTVAYYNSAGTEISTGTAYLVGGPHELTAGQHAIFEDIAAPQGAARCQVIGTDAGNS